MIAYEELLKRLNYDPLTGKFTRINKFVSRKVGYIDNDGYLVIRLLGKSYKASRLAWFYMMQSWPIHEIDHINRVRLDNRFLNLRDIPSTNNKRNNNGLGVCYDKQKDLFMAYTSRQYGQKFLGYFNSHDEARDARIKFDENFCI